MATKHFLEELTKNHNRMSAKFLFEYSKLIFVKTDNPSDEDEKRFAIIYDLFIKARSYGILNKIFFIFGLLLSLCVLIYPSLGIIYKKTTILQSSVIQTSITGLAALGIAIYLHYKKRQLYAENLIRYVVFCNDHFDQLIRNVMTELMKIDHGFAFNWSRKSESEKEDQITI